MMVTSPPPFGMAAWVSYSLRLLPPAQNCTHVGIQNGTVRDRGREPFGRRFADGSIVGSEG